MENTVNSMVEKFSLEDGRIAERHISTNEHGEKVIEVYVEEKRPLKLEKRVTEKRKEVLAEQRIETVVDGNVVDVKVNSIEPQVNMQLREHIAVADDTLHASNYVSKKELGPVVTDAVVAGVAALLESGALNARPEPRATKSFVPKSQQPAVFKAQAEVEERVEEKKKQDMVTIAVMAVIVVAQLAFFGYIMLVP